MASQVESIKWVPGTRFIVDGFRFQSPEKCTRYFLTHCHSDHTTGLTPSSFKTGFIYCSHVSYRLLIHDLNMRPDVLRPLDLNRPVIIDGVEVTPICANHCPGAVCFIFRVPSIQPGAPPTVILHTGDFRWCPIKHGQHTGLVDGVDILMLDTTYLQPKWTFPPQAEVVALMADIMRTENAGNNSKTLFVSSSYHIGKERAYLGAAKILNWKVWVPPSKRKVLNILDLPQEWMELLTNDEYEAQIHVYSSKDDLHEQALADRINNLKSNWTKVFLFKPTGWTYKPRNGTRVDPSTVDRREIGCVTIIGVPYSEHSSYPELQDCVKTLRPRKLIPTVNAGDAVKSRALVDRLCGLMDLSEDKTRLDSYFTGNSTGKSLEANGGDDGQGSWRGNVDRKSPLALPEKQKKDQLVDLSTVDIEEQKRLLEEAVAQSQGSNRKRQASSSAERQGDGHQSSKRESILSYFRKTAS